MQDVNMYHLIKFYAKNWAIIVLLVGFGILSGFIYNTFIQTPLYKSDATLLLIRQNDASAQNVILINNYVELFKSRRVLEPVIAQQNLNISYDDLVKSIEATSDKDTEVIKVAISTDNASASKTFIDGAIISFKEQVSKLYTTDNVQVVDNASLADQPYNVHKEIVLAFSAIAGLGVAIVYLFFKFDIKFNNNDDETTNGQTKVAESSNDSVQNDTKTYAFYQAPAEQGNIINTSRARAQWLHTLYSVERQPKR